jgi:probable rRNA maturation factor
MPRAVPIRVAVTVVIDDQGWLKLAADPARLLRRAVRAALKVARRPRGLEPGGAVALSVALMSDRGVQRLNRDFRGKDRPTNVLSFPAGIVAGRRVELGDIALALGVVRREAREQGKAPADHLAHLMVHGVLHLLEYDHENDHDAERMEKLERKALATLKIDDPYVLHGADGVR